MKKYLLILASLLSLSHSLVHCKDDKEVNWQNVGIGTVLVVGGGAIIYYCCGDKVRNYCNGSPAANTEVIYEPSLQEELLLFKDSAPDESAPIIIIEHKAHEELKDILHAPKNTPTQQAYSVLVTATAKLKEAAEATKEIFKNKTASEVFTEYPLD